MSLSDFKQFLDTRQIFFVKEIENVLGKKPRSTIDNTIKYHQEKGHILKIRSGFYYVVPRGIDTKKCVVDPYLIASHLTNDAVLGYQSALAFFGKQHSIRNDHILLTEKRTDFRDFFFQGVHYHITHFPQKLVDNNKTLINVETHNYLGEKVRVTNLERTFVDVLDRPNLIEYDWEEIWRSLESIAYLNLDTVLEYALLLETKLTIAKIGFFLEQHKDLFRVPTEFLKNLEQFCPKTLVYIDKRIKAKYPHRLAKRWNIYIPLNLYNKEWEEPHEDI